MIINGIERALRDLRLSGIAATLNTRVMQAQSSQQPFLETLAAMPQDELDRRHSRLTERSRWRHQCAGRGFAERQACSFRALHAAVAAWPGHCRHATRP